MSVDMESPLIDPHVSGTNRDTFASTHLSNIQEDRKQIRHEILQAVPSFLCGAGALLAVATFFLHVFEPLTDLQDFLEAGSSTTQETAKKLVESAGYFFQSIKKNSDKLEAAAQSPQEADDALIALVSGCLAVVANLALGISFAISAISLAVETERLYSVWRDILNSNQFKGENFVGEQTAIQDKIEQRSSEIKAFGTSLGLAQFEHMNANNRLCYHVTKTKERDALRESMSIIESDIGRLEKSVNQNVQKLLTNRCAAIPSVRDQILEGCTLTLIALVIGISAFTALLVLVLLAALCYTVTAGYGLYLWRECWRAITEIQRKLVDMERLRVELSRHRENLDTKFLVFSNLLIQGNDAVSMDS